MEVLSLKNGRCDDCQSDFYPLPKGMFYWMRTPLVPGDVKLSQWGEELKAFKYLEIPC